VLEDLSCAVPNMAYCGLPVQGLLAVIVGNLIFAVLILPLTMVILQLAAPPTPVEDDSAVRLVECSLLGAVKQPLVWLPVLGAVLAIAGGAPSRLIDHSIDQVGQERPHDARGRR
jgi:malonate transporter and related proteins